MKGRSGDTGGTAAVPWRTLDAHATGGSDYVAATGTANFATAVSTQPVVVTVNGDTVVEPTEDFLVRLSSPTSGYTVADATAWARSPGTTSTVPIPTRSTTSRMAEGDAGPTAFDFTVTRTGDTSKPASVD